MTRKFLNTTCLSILLFFCTAAMLSAQTIVTGGLTGTVNDPTGASVPTAALTLTSNTTADTYSTVTSAAGGYVFSLLKPGDYTLVVKKDGFKASSHKVTVLLGQTAT